MKYFIDCEFLEGKQNKTFLGFKYGETKPTIDLISIGIVAEDGREYYAISKDFNLKEAWNRFQMKQVSGDNRNRYPNGIKEYWIRDNVLQPIYLEFLQRETNLPFTKHKFYKHSQVLQDKFEYKQLKRLINKYGKTNKEIAEEIKEFVYYKSEEHKTACCMAFDNIIKPEFYGYYSDYDWVVFCWLFGKMIDLPTGFPMLMFDIQQLIVENNIDKKNLLKEVPQINCHNSLQDAIWNKNAFNWIQNIIYNGKQR